MKMNLFKKLSSSKGFTLIELLIVIAILGVLAAVILVAINPAQQFARARDAGRKTALSQITNALQAFYTTRQATYPLETNTWITALVNAGEVGSVPALTTYAVTNNGSAADQCSDTANNAREGDYCYADGLLPTDPVVAYVKLESGSEDNKCATASDDAFFAFDSATGVVCLVCATDNASLSSPVTCNPTQ